MNICNRFLIPFETAYLLSLNVWKASRQLDRRKTWNNWELWREIWNGFSKTSSVACCYSNLFDSCKLVSPVNIIRIRRFSYNAAGSLNSEYCKPRVLIHSTTSLQNLLPKYLTFPGIHMLGKYNIFLE